MESIEGIDTSDELSEFTGELSSLKEKIQEQSDKYEKSDIYINGKNFGIPDDFVINYIKKLENIYNASEIKAGGTINNEVKEMIFGQQDFDIEGLTNEIALIPFYLKSLSGNNFVEIFHYFENIVYIIEDQAHPSVLNKNFENLNSSIAAFLSIIRKYGDKSLTYLKFFFCKKESYNSYFDYGENTVDGIPEIIFRGMTTNFFELFMNEPEAPNLLDFLNKYPQKLDNLGGKEVKCIKLNKEEGFNFCFRGILEMVKSRDDINFPHLGENPTDDEKMQWKNEWEKIVREYEVLIKNYIAMDFDVDNNGEKHEKAKDMTFGKIFYASPIGDEVTDKYNISKERLQEYTKNEVADYSFKVDKHDRWGVLKEQGISDEEVVNLGKQMLLDVKEYNDKHPDEDVLVYVEQHGSPDGSSGNGWTKDDWIKLSNISPRIKIFSCRCYFGTAYENKDIYKHLSSVSGFSNESATNGRINSVVNEALNKGVGFNELEILSRLNYNLSITSLTENMEYTNRNTGETEIGKIGLAQNNNGRNSEFNNYS